MASRWYLINRLFTSRCVQLKKQLWDAPHVGNATPGRSIFTYRGHSAGLNALAWSPDGTRIASASDDQTVHIWNAALSKSVVASENDVFIYRAHSGNVNAIAWSPDGTRIASASSDETVQVWQAI